MYSEVADKLVVTEGTLAYSQAVSMQGANQLLFNVVVVAISGTAVLIVTLEEGNDLENWSQVTSTGELDIVGYSTEQTASGISSAYVRLRYEASQGGGSDKIIVEAGIDTADL